jgi:hypothetical protein
LGQDLLLQRLQGGARLETLLGREIRAHALVGGERVALPAAAIEREHELAREPLAAGVCRGKRLDLAGQRGVAPEPQVGLEAPLQRADPQLLQPPDLRLGPRLVADLGQRRSPQQRQRAGQEVRGAGRFALLERAAALLGTVLELAGVERAGRQREDVAADDGPQPAGVLVEFLAQAGDRHLHALARPGAGAAVPERLEQLVGRDGVTGVDDQEREEPQLPRRGNRPELLAIQAADRTEYSVTHHPAVST